MTLKVNHAGTVKEPERIFAKGESGTIYQVNYVLVNNSSNVPTTAWNAVYTTSRDTATTRATDTTNSTSFTTTFDTSSSTSNATTNSTSNATTTSFNTSFTTSYTTSFSTSRSTSRSTTGSYTSYQYRTSAPTYYWTRYTSGTLDNAYWNGGQIASLMAAGTTETVAGGYRYQRGPQQATLSDKIMGTYYRHSIRRRFEGTTTYNTSFTTSRSTSKTTSNTTSASTTTTFNTSFTTAFGTTASTSNTTSRDTTVSTTTTFDTATTVYERLTATGAETEVASGDAHNIRYWDGTQWTEET